MKGLYEGIVVNKTTLVSERFEGIVAENALAAVALLRAVRVPAAAYDVWVTRVGDVAASEDATVSPDRLTWCCTG